ncbi:MAG: relaxase [Candidatus Melainabacteria bacterium]|nr:relaxase [Candidatus Melainabacteria bacterium]
MILKGSQRGGAAQLAAHLLKTEENEHVEIHEISGFVSNDVRGAFREIQALSKGTRCTQYMFSVSLNPPERENVPVADFEKALTEIEVKTGLSGQPRVVVFHEKEGRRHCHAVWSRIKAGEMKAIPLPYYKMKLRDVSKQIYFEHGWRLPNGLQDNKNRDPSNYTLAEWQQAKRQGDDPKVIKGALQECWAVSPNKQAFVHALKQNGYRLARGDKRGFVAVDIRGEVYSLSRWLDVKSKALKERLGEPDDLPSVEQTKQLIQHQMTDRLKTYMEEVKTEAQVEAAPLRTRKRALVKYHRESRESLRARQEERALQEAKARQASIPRGLRSLWGRLTGEYQSKVKAAERDYQRCEERDKAEREALIAKQLAERRVLQTEFQQFKTRYQERMCTLRQEMAWYMEMGQAPEMKPTLKLSQARRRDRNFEPGM